MTMSAFGQLPYRAAPYTSTVDASADATAEVEEAGLLRSLLHDLMRGDLGRTHELAALVDAPNRDVRQYCHQLLADVCSHEQVDAFRAVLQVDALEPDEVCRVLVRLGDTLSPRAVPVILAVAREIDDAEAAG